jgi:hypothetical protein
MRQVITWLARALALQAAALLVLFAAPASAEHWSLPDDRLGVRTAPLLLLTRADVQADVKLTNEQVASLRRVVGELHSRASHLKGRPNPEVLTARRQIDEEQARWVEAELNRDQRRRLHQIDLQWEGPSALVSRGWVGEYVGITEDQRRTLTDTVQRSRAVGADTTTSGRAIGTSVLNALTDEQRQRWRSLLGEPFTLVEQGSARGPR